MTGLSARLLTVRETVETFQHDIVFQGILQRIVDRSQDIHRKISPRALEIIYGGTASEALTEIGTAMTNEFAGGQREISTIVTIAAAGITTGWYFLYDTGTTKYYVWMDKNGDGTTDDPGPVAGYTGLDVDISAAVTADNVATAVQGALTALGDVTASVVTDTVTAKNDNDFNVDTIVDVDTTFTFATTQTGIDQYAGAPVYFASADADDTDNSAKDLRKLIAIGFNKPASGNPSIKQEEKNMNGTTIEATTETKWIRIIHHGGSDWGSAGQDAKGIITMSDALSDVDYLVIAANENESEGAVIWVPDNFHVMIAEMELTLRDIAVAGAGDGILVQFVKSGFDQTKNNRLQNIDPDNPNIPISITRENPHDKLKWLTKVPLHGTDVAKLTLQEAKINTAHIFTFKTYVLLWYELNAATQTIA